MACKLILFYIDIFQTVQDLNFQLEMDKRLGYQYTGHFYIPSDAKLGGL